MLFELLDLEEVKLNCYRSKAHQANFNNSLFGGQAIAQALMAAGRTAKSKPPHSLHAYFLLPGKADTPITYQVGILRDGRSVSTREVKAYQHDRCIFTMQASFHKPESGFQHTTKAPINKTAPEILKSQFSDAASTHLKHSVEGLGVTPIDFIPFNMDLFEEQESKDKDAQFWVKSSSQLPEDPLFHYCALAFSSDIGLLGTAMLPHDCSLFGGSVIPASMDHSLWFHSEPEFNQWHRYVTKSSWAGGGRALCQGEIFDGSDTLIATSSQEGMIRLNKKP